MRIGLPFSRTRHTTDAPRHVVTSRMTPPVLSDCSAQCLARNAGTYGYLASQLTRIDWRRDPLATLDLIEQLADFAATNHPGRFADGTVENIAAAMGRHLEQLIATGGLQCRNPIDLGMSDGRRRVLHVGTSTTGIGGWTRTLVNWINLDPGSRHSVILTRQEYPERVRPWLRDAIAANGGSLVVMPQNVHPLVRALWLREVAYSSADLVVLHINWSDVLPAIAFAVNYGPPVALVNQVDHLFWLGSSVVDAVINLRDVENGFNEKRRFTKRDLFLPIPLSDSAGGVSRPQARLALGLPPEQVMLLTVGREVKYLPDATHNFFVTAVRLLEQHPESHLYVIGVDRSYARNWLGDPCHARLHFLGILENAALHQIAADVYLESFPFGSQTALLEAALAGTFPVRAYSPPSRLLASFDEAIDDICPAPQSEEEYIASASRLMNEPSNRLALGRAIRERVQIVHCGVGWRHRLQQFYSHIAQISHQPATLPSTGCACGSEDTALSAWHESLASLRRERTRYEPNLASERGFEQPPPSVASTAIETLILQLRDRTHRTSRRASTESLNMIARWIDVDAGPHKRPVLRRALLASIAERMTWDKWERAWVSYWNVRAFVEHEWRFESDLPRIATRRLAPVALYRLRDALDRGLLTLSRVASSLLDRWGVRGADAAPLKCGGRADTLQQAGGTTRSLH